MPFRLASDPVHLTGWEITGVAFPSPLEQEVLFDASRTIFSALSQGVLDQGVIQKVPQSPRAGVFIPGFE